MYLFSNWSMFFFLYFWLLTQTCPECNPLPTSASVDAPLHMGVNVQTPNQEIVDQLTNNFAVKTLKANRNNIRKLSGHFMPGQVVHSSSHSSSSIVSDINGNVNTLKTDEVSNVDATNDNNNHLAPPQVQHSFQFEELGPNGLVLYGNNIPIYVTPLGLFKPKNANF